MGDALKEMWQKAATPFFVGFFYFHLFICQFGASKNKNKILIQFLSAITVAERHSHQLGRRTKFLPGRQTEKHTRTQGADDAGHKGVLEKFCIIRPVSFLSSSMRKDLTHTIPSAFEAC